MFAQLSATLKVRNMPTAKLIEKMQMSLIPSEKDLILDACDELHRRCRGCCFRAATNKRVLDAGGAELLLDVMDEWRADEVAPRARRAIATDYVV